MIWALLVALTLPLSALCKCNLLLNRMPSLDHSKGVLHFTTEMQKASLITIEDQLFYQDGKLLNTGKRGHLFIIDRNNNLLTTMGMTGKIHHSSLSAGESVYSAGWLVVFDGRLIAINNESGHYRPTKQHLEYALEYLREKEIDLSSILVYDFSSSQPKFLQRE